ncbi:alanine racemase [Aquimarina aggregata]|uniref:Alanine racemase n=2 Tax=Aquimarina aggregata TaxID=1642818 RepID=A0A163CG09_9FLAO|nr:alanine racemase [Aquimarina aggregata]
MHNNMKWYNILNIDEIDSPSIVLYEDHLKHNLNTMITMVDNDLSKLMPHIKTNKMPKVIRQMITLGIKSFKTATIAEAEIAAVEGATHVLIAHQLVGSKVMRFIELIKTFKNTRFSTIVDNIDSAKKLHHEAVKQAININIYIDINNGMDRSGIEIGIGLENLIEQIDKCLSLNFLGFHVYDGHLRTPDFKQRKDRVEEGFKNITTFFETLKHKYPNIEIISGGTPSFTSHLTEKDRICSPGTCILWDWGYDQKLTEQEYKYAALVITRVISKPKKNVITIDLGNKAIASENPIDSRVKFLNLFDYELISQSEEHGVLSVQNWNDIKVGDVLYGVPYHICPTINLYDEVSVIVHSKKIDSWDITARKRKITI